MGDSPVLRMHKQEISGTWTAHPYAWWIQQRPSLQCTRLQLHVHTYIISTHVMHKQRICVYTHIAHTYVYIHMYVHMHRATRVQCTYVCMYPYIWYVYAHACIYILPYTQYIWRKLSLANWNAKQIDEHLVWRY